MVYLDGSAIDDLRLGTCEHLADHFGAYVTGLSINVLPDLVPPIEPADAAVQLSTTLQNMAREVGDQTEAVWIPTLSSARVRLFRPLTWKAVTQEGRFRWNRILPMCLQSVTFAPALSNGSDPPSAREL